MVEMTRKALAIIWSALEGPPEWASRLRIEGAGDLLSAFAVSDLAGASVGAAALAVAEFAAARAGVKGRAAVDRRMSSFWFGSSIEPQGWSLPPIWDAVAGDYETADGWIRLHTNAPHHRAAALAVLDTPAERQSVAAAVRLWPAEALESAIVERGGCAAQMRSAEAWTTHPQGRAIAAKPLLGLDRGSPATRPPWPWNPDRPLQGIRVLDMTRVIAGPVATRFLAGFGAEVLRIDPPGWDEPAALPDMTLGKRCARLDLRVPRDMRSLEHLLSRADVLVHGYRPDAMVGLNLGAARRAGLCPGLVDVSLDAYGWTGPWRHRRGFDSLVQMSSGIAEAGMRFFGRDRPTPLPVQALDHATGYIMAAAVIRGLTRRLTEGVGSTVRTSLARTALMLGGLSNGASEALPPRASGDFQGEVEMTAWGAALRLRPPCLVDGAPMRWDRPATMLGSALAAW